MSFSWQLSFLTKQILFQSGIVIELEIFPLHVMWCLRYCPCWKGSTVAETENSGLLGSSQWQSKETEATKTQYYTVRRISSFGRTGSGDDISDTGREQGDIVQSPAEFWTPKLQRIQPGVVEEGCRDDTTDSSVSPRQPCKPQPPHGRWRRALHTLKPQRESKSRDWREGGFLQPPPITVSSPDLQREDEEEETSPHMKHAGTVTNVSSITVIQPQTRWFKSQSMQDINTAIQTGSIKKDETVCKPLTQKEEAEQIARSYGLDTSMYACQTGEYAPMSRSNEALNAWRSSANTDKLNLHQEAACGHIHFSVSYYQKNKRLLVHIDRLEGLPPKGDHYTYNVIVKLTVLPLEKPVRVTKMMKNDLNPVIDEDFEFCVKDPLGKVLRLSVYDADHQGKYDAVGHALFYLEDVIAGRPRRYTMKLYKQSQPDVAPGNINVMLTFKRETLIVTVLVKEARNLLLTYGVSKNSRLTDKYNTYVKVVYFSAGQKMKSKKTSVVPSSRNPTYNQTFSFKLSTNFLHDSMIVLSVMMKGLFKKDVPIGRLVLGPFHYAEEHVRTPWGRALVDEEEVNHWFRMYL